MRVAFGQCLVNQEGHALHSGEWGAISGQCLLDGGHRGGGDVFQSPFAEMLDIGSGVSGGGVSEWHHWGQSQWWGSQWG
ncbi:hypothetical protein GCM10012319_32000 [Comamonas sp. KCTC 72670]|nr:hypothetical protein GCM10012319_32000 [Comamonas sp. KCTC 72670]